MCKKSIQTTLPKCNENATEKGFTRLTRGTSREIVIAKHCGNKRGRERAVSRANFAHLGCENEVDLKRAHARAKVGIGQDFHGENVADSIVDSG